jgi:hypothetical protein
MGAIDNNVPKNTKGPKGQAEQFNAFATTPGDLSPMNPGMSPDNASRLAQQQWQDDIQLATGKPVQPFVTLKPAESGEYAFNPPKYLNLPPLTLRDLSRPVGTHLEEHFVSGKHAQASVKHLNFPELHWKPKPVGEYVEMMVVNPMISKNALRWLEQGASGLPPNIKPDDVDKVIKKPKP